MKKIATIATVFIGILCLVSCTKTESDFSTVSEMEVITIKPSAFNTTAGGSLSFTVNSSISNNDVTSQSKVYVNGILITGNNYTFPKEGSYAVYATKGTINSNILTIQATKVSAGFVSNVLVEEYSGTWCGNCPRMLYGIDLLHKQTEKAIVVGIHLFNNDPFITTMGNDLAASLGVTGVPTGNVNRTASWSAPQYEYVDEVINQIKPFATIGLSINSSVSGNNLTASIKVAYDQPLNGNAKLTVYLVEDHLLYIQRNYSSNIYNGDPYITDFEYNGVLRTIISSNTGDAIANAGSMNDKTYTLALPSNIANIANARIVAFLTNAAGTVVNVQQAKIGVLKDFERL